MRIQTNKSKWQEVELKDVTEIVSGSTPSTTKEEYWDNGNINWITPAEITDGNNGYYHETKKKITKKGLESASINLFPRGTVMLTSRAPIGKVAIAGGEMCSNQGFKNFICDTKKIHPEYLYHWLRSKKEYLNSIGRGATFKEISKSIVSKIKIPFPPLPLQKHIVSILEKAETLKQKREEADKLTKEYLQSVFYEMFLKEGKYPLKELEECCIRKGEYGSGGSAIEFDSSKPRYIRITDITDEGNLREDSKATPSIIEDDYLLEEGDILFARSGATVGKTYLHTKKYSPAIFAGYLIRFKSNKKLILPEFLFYFTKTQYYLSWVSSEQKVVAQPNINAQQYGHDVKIPLPPLPLQQTFSSIVEHVERLKEKQKESKTEINQLFDSLMQKAFNGELIQ